MNGPRGHGIKRFTADQTEARSYVVGIECACGTTYDGIPAAAFSGVMDVAMQAFLSHLAASRST